MTEYIFYSILKKDMQCCSNYEYQTLISVHLETTNVGIFTAIMTYVEMQCINRFFSSFEHVHFRKLIK